MEVLKKMAGDILFCTIVVEGVFGKDEICFLSCAPVGEAVSDEKDNIIFFPVDLDKLLFASPAKTTLLLGVRERDFYPFPLQEMGTVGIKGNLRKMVNFKNLLDIEIETIADNFDIDAFLLTILIERREGRIDV